MDSRHQRPHAWPVWACLLLSLFLAGASRAAEPAGDVVLRRWAVLATSALREAGAADLVAVRLAAAGVTLVERGDLPALAEELVRAEVAGAASATRLKLGKLLGADALLLLSLRPAQGEQPAALTMAISETRWGARLWSEELPWEPAGREATLQQVAELALQMRQRFAGGVRRIVGLSPFLCNDFTLRYAYLQASFTRLLEAELLTRPGVAVLEIEEARALARELAQFGGAIADRPLPCFVEMEYRTQSAEAPPEKSGGKAAALQIIFKGKVLAGDGAAKKIAEHTTTLDHAAAHLRTVATNLLLNGPAGEAPVLAADEQFKVLTRRADTFFRLGFHHQALVLREAALLVQPQNLLQRRRLLDDSMEFLKTPKADEHVLRQAEEGWRRSLDHLEVFIRRQGLTADGVRDLAYQLLTLAPRGPGAEENNRIRRAFLRDLAPTIAQQERLHGDRAAFWWGLFPSIAEQPVTSGGLQAEDFELVFDVLEGLRPATAPPTLGTIDFLVPGRFTQTPTVVRERQKLRERLARSERPLNPWLVRVADYQAKIDHYLLNLPEAMPQELLAMEEALLGELQVRGQAYSPKDIKKIGESLVRNPRVGLEIRIKEEAKRTATARPDKPPARTPARPQGQLVRADEHGHLEYQRLRFDALQVRYVYEPASQPYGPIGFLSDVTILPVDKNVELWCTSGGVWMMREPGVLERLPEQNQQEMAVRDAAWDGRFIYLAVLHRNDQRQGIEVRDVSGRRLQTITTLQGLPPGYPHKLHALAEGKLLALGVYGERSWCALVQADGGGWAVRLFYEGKHSSARVGAAAQVGADVDIAFAAERLHLLRVGARTVLVTTNSRRPEQVFLIDPEGLEVSRLAIASPTCAAKGVLYKVEKQTCYRWRLTGPPWRLEPMAALPLPPGQTDYEEFGHRLGKYLYMHPSWRRLDLETLRWETLGDPGRPLGPAPRLGLNWMGESVHHGLVGGCSTTRLGTLYPRLYRVAIREMLGNEPQALAHLDVAPVEQPPLIVQPPRLAPAARRGLTIPEQPLLMPAAWRMEPAVLHRSMTVSCSPDGAMIATVSAGALHLWDAQTGELLRHFALPKVHAGTWGRLDSVAWSRDGARLAVGNGPQAVDVFDIAQLWRVASLRYNRDSGSGAAVWSHDGARLLIATGNSIRVWDWASRGWVQTPSEGAAAQKAQRPAGAARPAPRAGVVKVSQLGLSPDGRRLLSLVNDVVVVWSVGEDGSVRAEDERILASAEARPPAPTTLSRPEPTAVSRAWWTDNSELAVLTQVGCLSLNGRPLAGGRQVLPVTSMRLASFAIRPDGRRLLVRDDLFSSSAAAQIFTNREARPGVAQRVDLADPPVVRRVAALTDVTAMDWLPGGERVAAVVNGTLMSVRADTGAVERAVAVAPHRPSAVAWSPDGRYLACAWDSVLLFDATTGRPHRKLSTEARVTALAWSPQGKLLAVAGAQNLQLFNAEDGSLIREHAGDGPVAWSPDGQLLVHGRHMLEAPSLARRWSADAPARLWKPEDKAKWSPYSAAWSPRGDKLAMGTDRGLVRIFEPQAGELLGEFQVEQDSGSTRSLTWFDDGRHLMIRADLWDWTSKAKVREWYRDSSAPLTAVLPASDGGPAMVLARIGNGSAGAEKVAARLWDRQTEGMGASVRFDVDRGFTPVCALAPDGRRLAAVDLNGGVGVWDLRNRKRLATLFNLRNDQWAVVSPTGVAGTTDAARWLVVTVDTQDAQQLLTIEEFSRIYEWKNNPESVTLVAPE